MPSEATKPITSAKRTVSPFMFIVMAFLAGCAMLAVFVGVLSTIEPELPTSSALAEVVMPDGNILALEAVTYGTSHTHSVERNVPGFSFFSGASNYPISHSTPDNVIMVWLSKRNARTGKAMDFDWWTHCATVDSHGCEIRDREGYNHRDAIHGYGSSGSGGGRPYSPLSSHGGHQEYDTIIVRTALSPMRHDGDTFQLRVYDTSGKSVGEFTIKDPSPQNGKYPKWKPQTLPITADAGDMKVTLNSVKNVIHEDRGSRNGVPYVRKRSRLQFQFSMEEDGQPSHRWNSNSVTVSDAIGNSINPYDVSQLCTKESAWKLTAHFWRGTEEENFKDSELWRVKDVVPPAKNKFKMLNQSTVVDGASVEVVAVGGPGKMTYRGLNTAHTGGYSSSGSVNSAGKNHQYEVDRQNGRGTPNTTTVTCDVPHVLLRWSTAHPHQRVDRLAATDGEGRPVRLDGPHGGGYNGDTGVYFLTRPREAKTEDPIKKVNLLFAVQTAREAEFLVKPPEPTPPEPRYYTPQTLAQRKGSAQRNIARYEKEIASNSSRGYNHYRFALAVVMAPEELRTPELLKKAVTSAERAVAEAPQTPHFQNVLAMAYLRNDDGRALVRFQDNLVNDLGDNQSIADLYGLALTHFQAGAADLGKKTFERAVARHRNRMGYIQSSSEWHRLYDLRDEVQGRILGSRPSEMLAKADELVTTGELEKAAETLDELLKVHEDDHWPWYRSAALQLYIEDKDTWKKQCDRMMKVFGKSTHPETAERVGKSCLLSPSIDEATRTHAQGLIEIALAKKPDSMWFTLAKGLGQYRAEMHADSIKSLQRALTLRGRASTADVCIHAVMAMAQFRSDEKDAARESLSTAQTLRAEKVPTLTDGNLRKDSWHDVFIADILLREATAVVGE